MNRLRIIHAAAILAACSFAANAQISSAVGDFTLERVLTLNSIISPIAPTFPPPVLAGIQAGTIEIHQLFVYTSAQHKLEQFAFVVPANSAVPFPSPGSAPVADHYIMQVDSVAVTASPGPSVVITAHVLSNDAPTPWGDITGAIITLAFGYQGSGPGTQYGPVTESVSPLYGLYTPTGAGSFSSTASAQKCTNAVLNGTYMFRLNGSLQTGTGTFGPFVDDGLFVADGNGSLTVFDSGSAAGSVFLNRTFPIAYSLNDNCTGTFKWPGAGMDVQVSKDGRKINMVFTAPSSVIANGSGVLQ